MGIRSVLSAITSKNPQTENEQLIDKLSTNQDFLSKMRVGPHRWHNIELCSPEGEIYELPMRILTIKEVMDIEKESLSWYNELPECQRTLSLLEKQKAILTLMRACSSHARLNDSSLNKETIECLSLEDILFLLKKYDEVCQKFNPSMDEMTEEELRGCIDDLEKKPQLVSSLSRSKLEKVTLHLLALVKEKGTLEDSLYTSILQDDSI